MISQTISLIISAIMMLSQSITPSGANTDTVLSYTFYENTLSSSSEYEGNQINTVFEKVGINGLMSIKSISQINLLTSITTSTNSNSDWIGPYMVKEQDEQDETSEEARFTGGWHGSNGDGTGEPTAHTVNVKVFADGEELSSFFSGEAKVITLIVTNHIESYNKGNEVLEEVVTYQIYNNRIDVNVKITALKDIEILRYYGLQSLNKSYDQNIEYFYLDGTSKKSEKHQYSDSGYEKIIYSFELSSYNEAKLYAWLNPTCDLAQFDYLEEDQPYVFTMSYGKTYFNLVNGIILKLDEGESISWSGGYVIK